LRELWVSGQSGSRRPPQRYAATVPFLCGSLDLKAGCNGPSFPHAGVDSPRGRHSPAAAGIMLIGEQRFAHLGRRQHALLVAVANIDRLLF